MSEYNKRHKDCGYYLIRDNKIIGKFKDHTQAHQNAEGLARNGKPVIVCYSSVIYEPVGSRVESQNIDVD